VHVEDPVQTMQLAPNCPQKLSGWCCYFK